MSNSVPSTRETSLRAPSNTPRKQVSRQSPEGRHHTDLKNPGPQRRRASIDKQTTGSPWLADAMVVICRLGPVLCAGNPTNSRCDTAEQAESRPDNNYMMLIIITIALTVIIFRTTRVDANQS